jgi:hypothetical protein
MANDASAPTLGAEESEHAPTREAVARSTGRAKARALVAVHRVVEAAEANLFFTRKLLEKFETGFRIDTPNRLKKVRPRPGANLRRIADCKATKSASGGLSGVNAYI